MPKLVLWMLLALLLSGRSVLAQDRTEQNAQGKQFFFDQGCYGCHMVGKMGTPIGPDLSQVGAKYPPSYLSEWLRDPSAQKPKAHMPKIALSEGEIRALTAFLSSLR
jgi:cytochrome c oxidase subunit 2